MMTRMKELEEEKRRLKKMYAKILQEAMAKKPWSRLCAKRWRSRSLLSGALNQAGLPAVLDQRVQIGAGPRAPD